MTEEIKEILNKLLEYFKESNINDFGYEKDKLISYEEAQILLNYITNLQKENKDLKESNHNWQRKLSDYKQRNEKAVELLEEYKYTEVDDYVKVIEFYKKIKKVLQGDDE